MLGEIGDKRAAPALKQMLSHKNRDHRLWAGYGLAKLADPMGVPVVLEFMQDPQWLQRRHAADALGTFGDRRAVPALLEALKAGRNYDDNGPITWKLLKDLVR